MKIETFTSIEVLNVTNIWAVDLDECTIEMEPVIPKFISVHNCFDSDGRVQYVDHVLSNFEPEKIIEGVTVGIADDYKEVGFWRLKSKS